MSCDETAVAFLVFGSGTLVTSKMQIVEKLEKQRTTKSAFINKRCHRVNAKEH